MKLTYIFCSTYFYMKKIYFFCLLILLFEGKLFSQAPGGVTTNLKLWLKAEDYNAGTTTWTDASTNSLDFIADGTNLTPSRIENFINFNPVTSYNFTTSPSFTLTALQSERNPGFVTGSAARNSIVVASSSLPDNQFRANFSYGTTAPLTTTVGQAFINGGSGSSAAMSIKPVSTGGGPMVSSMTIPNVYNTANTDFNIVTAGVNSSGNLLLQANAEVISTVAPSVAINTTNNIARVGSAGGAGSNNRVPWRGHLAEAIFYDSDYTLTPANINRIYTYLALKYGIPLLNGAGFDYLNSDGTTIWDATAKNGYNYDVFGIGRDATSGLNQQISKSNNNDFLILSTDNNFTNANGTHTVIATDKSYFMVGHNNLGTNFLPYSTGINVNQIMLKRWSYSAPGAIGSVNISVNDATATHMLVSNDPTFATGVTEVPITAQVVTHNFGTGSGYFTFAKKVFAPGGVFNNSSSSNGVYFEVYNGYDSTPENGFSTTTLLQKGVSDNFYDLDKFLTNEQRDSYTIQAKATLTISSTTNYYFRFEANDDMALFIDDALVFSGNSGTTTMGSPINLTAGNHSIEVRFSENTTTSTMRLTWSTDNVTYTAIPDNLLTIPDGSASMLNWYRADIGISDADGATLTNWQDQSGYDADLVSITGTPKFYNSTVAQLFNFNPSVFFDYDKAMTTGYSANVFVGENPRTSFVVSSKINRTFQFFTGIGGGDSSGNNYFGIGSDFYKQAINFSSQSNTSSTTDYYTNNTYLTSVKVLNPAISPANNLLGLVNNNSIINNSLTTAPTYLSNTGYFSVGDVPSGTSTGFNGNIMEVLHYPFVLNNAETTRVQSYLGLKYGISLSEGTGINYTASNGTTVFWNAASNAGFNYGIFGIGRDDISVLEQQISTSSRNKSILTISTDNNFVLPNKSHTAIPTNLSFFMVGNNGLDIDYNDYASSVIFNKIMKRKWKVQETGTNLGNINLSINDPNVTHLLVSTDPSFATINSIVPLVGKTIAFDFSNGQYFTYGFNSSGTAPTICPAPGNPACKTDVVIWIKNEPFDESKIVDQMFLQIDAYTKGIALTQVVDPTVDIANPYPGMLVFDTTEDCLKIYRNASWSGCILLDQN